MINNPDKTEDLQVFLLKNKDLFWHFNKTKLNELPLEIIVEYILNYGSEMDVKELITIIGIDKISKVFYKTTKNKQRTNYFPEVQNFFTLYFNRNAHGNTKS